MILHFIIHNEKEAIRYAQGFQKGLIFLDCKNDFSIYGDQLCYNRNRFLIYEEKTVIFYFHFVK